MRPTGFEPATFRVGAERAIQLRYGRILYSAVLQRLLIIAKFFENCKGFPETFFEKPKKFPENAFRP